MIPARRWLAGTLMSAAVLCVWLLITHKTGRPAGAAHAPLAAREEPARASRHTASRPAVTAHRQFLDDWAALERWLLNNPEPEAIRSRLGTLRQLWVGMDWQVLASAISGQLATGDDLPTGLPFAVGPNGLLTSWPSLRVFLLDALAIADPAQAATIAREVLDSTSSADEYAVALRALTREGPGRAENRELLSHFARLLDHHEWRDAAGFAEAFDMPRFLGDPQAARLVASWNGNPELKQMAMHEYAAEHPASAAMLASMCGSDPTQRARLMARCRPSDPAQAAEVARYLRDPAISPAEANLFLECYPFRGATTGYRLYGRAPAPFTRRQIAEDDLAALQQASSWLADPTLAQHHSPIAGLKQRLEDWQQDQP
ncbi:MAG: hypothetical protein MUF04_07955 [Akkermansiaceae bacterium]|jgi:hypothetical protein|nr:hypothetical protein [Akkermansiaceae bacterium]